MTGKEVELREGSDLEYFSPDCKLTQNVNTENTYTSDSFTDTQDSYVTTFQCKSELSCSTGAKPKRKPKSSVFILSTSITNHNYKKWLHH